MKDTYSPKELAEIVGVSESSIKRWIDSGRIEAVKTHGGHRRIEVPEAVRFIREGNYPVIRPEALGVPRLEGGDLKLERGSGDPSGLLFEYLSQGNAVYAQGLLLSLFLSGWSLAEICDGPLRGALERLGELWKHGPEGIYLEHRATDICVASVNRIRGLCKENPKAPLALGGAPEGDPYLLPTLCASVVLASEGYRAMNLGPNLPYAALLEGVNQNSPQCVWLSVSYVENPKEFVKNFDRFSAVLDQRRIPLAVGGRKQKDLPLAPRDRMARIASMAELVSFIRGLTAGGRGTQGCGLI